MILEDLMALDFETGGTDPAVHPILSIGAWTVQDGGVHAYHAYVLPSEDAPIDPVAAALNGYSREKWIQNGAEPLAIALANLMEWVRRIKGRLGRKPVPLAHNATFDRMFMEAAEKLTGIPITSLLDYHWECSMSLLSSLIRAGLIPPGKVNLDRLCALQEVPRSPVHNALDDAAACFTGYRWLLSRLHALTPFPVPANADTETQANP